MGQYQEQDVIKQNIKNIVQSRIKWLILGFIFGLIATLIVSYFEKILSKNIYFAFFIPIIVYFSDAVGTQSETIFIREIKETKNLIFKKYLKKEIAIGFIISLISGLGLFVFSYIWLKNLTLSLILLTTMIINITFSPILAIFIPNLLYHQNTDPALGAGPLATIIQDLISILIYFLIVILFSSI